MKHQEYKNGKTRNGASAQTHQTHPDIRGQQKSNAQIRFSDAMYTDNLDEMDMLDSFGAHSLSATGATPHLKKRHRERTLYTGRRKGKRKDNALGQKDSSQFPASEMPVNGDKGIEQGPQT